MRDVCKGWLSISLLAAMSLYSPNALPFSNTVPLPSIVDARTARDMYTPRRWRSDLERTLPRGGTDESFARYFAEITLDVVEEQTFQKRLDEEVGPRHVHLRQNALGEVTIPPHIEENHPGEQGCQMWTENLKVNRSMFILDRRLESHVRTLKDTAAQRHVPMLRAAPGRKNFGVKSGPQPLNDSFRATVLNKARKSPLDRSPMDMLPM